MEYRKVVICSSDDSQEVRTLPPAQSNIRFEKRAEGEQTGRFVEGYAALWNTISPPSITPDGLVFQEQISPNAFHWEDVAALFNHNHDLLLAHHYNDRPPEENTLTLIQDDIGLKYSFVADNTTDGNNLVERLRNKNVFQSSFAFFVDPDGDSWELQENGISLRTIKKAEVIDVSPVIFPFYPETVVNVRGLRDWIAQKQKQKSDTIKLRAKAISFLCEIKKRNIRTK